MNHWRKARSLGPAANHPDTKFDCEGKKVTVAEYFTLMCKDPKKGPIYRAVLKEGRLKYPDLPTINVGSKDKPVLIPPELVVIADGQCRTRVCTGDMTASMIK